MEFACVCRKIGAHPDASELRSAKRRRQRMSARRQKAGKNSTQDPEYRPRRRSGNRLPRGTGYKACLPNGRAIVCFLLLKPALPVHPHELGGNDRTVGKFFWHVQHRLTPVAHDYRMTTLAGLHLGMEVI